jgi:hypothetical protein
MTTTSPPNPLPPYVLVTPARDELAQLPALVEAVQAQDHRPCVWLVVDDGSTDGSVQWLSDAAAQLSWLHAAPFPDPPVEYLGAHVARVKAWGAERALEIARRDGLEPAYLAVLDADLTPAPDYFATVVARMEGDPRLGVASGLVTSPGQTSEQRIESFQRTDLPRGGIQVFRCTCLEQIGGLPPYAGYDGIANVKAGLRGWQRRLYTDLVVEQVRATATRFGSFAGFRKKGRYAWSLGLNPALVLARTAAYAARSPRREGLAFLLGWAEARWTGPAPCPDAEVRRYYRWERPREYARVVADRLLGRDGQGFV